MADIRVEAPLAPVFCYLQDVPQARPRQIGALSGCQGYSPGAVPAPPPIPGSHSP
jgi:hypothetical protein